MADGPSIELRKVVKRYRGPGGPVIALRNLSFELDAGAGLLLMGPPGSGKSTLLALVGALLRPTRGEVLVGGNDLARRPEHQLARFRQQKVGFLFQGHRPIQGLSASENVELALIPRGLARRERQRRATNVLEELGVGDRASFRINDLSGGEQQRVALARALVCEPSLLIADEPTSNVDRPTAELVLERLLARKQAGATVLIASHDPDLVCASGLVDRVAHFEQGGVVRVE